MIKVVKCQDCALGDASRGNQLAGGVEIGEIQFVFRGVNAADNLWRSVAGPYQISRRQRAWSRNGPMGDQVPMKLFSGASEAWINVYQMFGYNDTLTRSCSKAYVTSDVLRLPKMYLQGEDAGQQGLSDPGPRFSTNLCADLFNSLSRFIRRKGGWSCKPWIHWQEHTVFLGTMSYKVPFSSHLGSEFWYS